VDYWEDPIEGFRVFKYLGSSQVNNLSDDIVGGKCGHFCDSSQTLGLRVVVGWTSKLNDVTKDEFSPEKISKGCCVRVIEIGNGYDGSRLNF
jgi:hypothetical protein